ncbi:spliceosome-associated protein 130 A-like [Vitis riparia]|uniref:spliceosome-associated protein 130 A-like n=1 Tax=Vitis riparia TaxID=96939 RepID=UPI00155A775A|nr:spliceosome-associated protein 130 A-like [Vitis riparia]
MATGQLSDVHSRSLGLRAPKIFCVIVRGQRAMLCLSSHPRLGYIHRGHFLLTPLSYETVEFAASFSSDQCAEGVVVAAAGDALRIFTIERLGEIFNETVIPLRYTPRRFVLQPKQKLLVIIESDQGGFATKEREAAKKECFEAAEAEELRNFNVNLQLENSELAERLEAIQAFASFVLKCPKVEVRKLNHNSRHENEDLPKKLGNSKQINAS